MDKSVYDYLGEKYGGQWRDVVGYEGLYCVSDDGRVVSLNYNKTGKIRIMKQVKSNNKIPYNTVILSKHNKIKRFLIHRIVANAFIPNPENKPHIDHINTIKTDNRVENLRWCTAKENLNNPLTRNKNLESCKKSVIQLTLSGEFVRFWEYQKDAADYVNCTQGLICVCCQGKQKTAKGFRWLYADDYYKSIEKQAAEPLHKQTPVQLSLF